MHRFLISRSVHFVLVSPLNLSGEAKEQEGECCHHVLRNYITLEYIILII